MGRNHTHSLGRLLGQPLRSGEFADDRLGRRLSHDDHWNALEASLWRATLVVHQLELEGIRLDSTTSYGHHQVTETGIMQLGHSKDHRPDLPQLKLMVAAAEPSGHLIGSDLHRGNKADDPLYTPLIRRVRDLLGRWDAEGYSTAAIAKCLPWKPVLRSKTQNSKLNQAPAASGRSPNRWDV